MQTVMEIYKGTTQFSTMPNAGGLFDQDARLMYILFQVQEYVNIRKQMDEKKQGI